MRRILPILCLLLAACDREERGNYDASRNLKSSDRSIAPVSSSHPTRRPDPALTPEEEAVMNDPEARRLRMRFREAWLKNQDAPTQEGIILYHVARQDLAAYYAAHHPAAGLAWMCAQEGDSGFFDYAPALYRANPDAAIRALRSLTSAADRSSYTMALVTDLTPVDLERLWQIVIDPAVDFENSERLIRYVNGTRASFDPEAAWEKWQSDAGDPADVAGFLDSIRPLDPGVIYPTHLLDRVPEDQRADAVDDAFNASGWENLGPLKTWLSAQPVNPLYDNNYRDMAAKHTHQGDPVEAARWIERITDEAIKRSALLDVRDAEELKKNEE